MPLSSKSQHVLDNMIEQYGAEKGRRIFYATANKEHRVPETWDLKVAAAGGYMPVTSIGGNMHHMLVTHPATMDTHAAMQTVRSVAPAVRSHGEQLISQGIVHPDDAHNWFHGAMNSVLGQHGIGLHSHDVEAPVVVPQAQQFSTPGGRTPTPPFGTKAAAPVEVTMHTVLDDGGCPFDLLSHLFGGAAQGGIPGGLAEGKPDSAFDTTELAKGTGEETAEHTDGSGSGILAAKDIAKDHLTEDPEYYDKEEQREAAEKADKEPKDDKLASFGCIPFLVVR